MKGTKGLRAGAVLLAVVALSGCDAFMSSDKRVERARQEAASGDPAAAIIDLRNVLNRDPNHLQARLMLIELSVAHKDMQTARTELDKLASAGGRTAHTDELSAQVRLAQGEAADVLKMLQDGRLAPAEPARSVLRAQALLMVNRAPEAASEFERLLTADPKLTAARVGFARSLAAQGKSDDALRLLNETPDDASKSYDLYVLQGQIFLSRGQYAQAEAAFTRGKQLPEGSLGQRAMLVAALVETQLAQGNTAAAETSEAELAKLLPGSPVTRMLRGRIALAKGDYAGGSAELQRAVTAAPDFVQARMVLGVAHLAQGNLLQAESQLAQVVDSAPDNIEARTLLARVRLQLDRPDAAAQALTPALEQNSNDSQVYALLGAAQFRAGKQDESVDILERGLRAKPGDRQLQFELAEAYIRARQYPKAIDLLRSVPHVTGDVTRESLLIGALAMSQGQVAARSEVDKLASGAAPDPALLRMAAAYYVSQRQFERARQFLKQVLDKNPSDGLAYVGLASLENAAGNPQAAEAALLNAVKSDGKRPGYRLALAQLYLRKGDAARARAMLDEAIELSPKKAEAVDAAGQMLLVAQRYEEALARFRQATELDPKKAAYWVDTGRAQLALNQSVPASESFQKALAIEPDSLAAASALAFVELRTKGAEAALARAQELRRRYPDKSAVMILEGDIYMAQKQYRQAADAYLDAERAEPSLTIAVKAHEALKQARSDAPDAPILRWLALQPDDVRARLVLGQFYLQTQRMADAASQLQTVDKQLPNNPTVLNNLAWVYQQQGDRRAEEVARRAHELAGDNPIVADTYGWILLKSRKENLALPVLETAARGAPDVPEIQYHYGAALAASGRRAEAKAVLQRVAGTRRDFDGRPDMEKLLADLSG